MEKLNGCEVAILVADGFERLEMTEARKAFESSFAGAKWIDEERVRGENLVTIRKLDPVPAFSRAMIELFSKRPKTKRKINSIWSS